MLHTKIINYTKKTTLCQQKEFLQQKNSLTLLKKFSVVQKKNAR